MTADQLRKSILQQAIQGKLVPQDPNDEPASVLLERIREEKARLIKEKKAKREKNPSVIFRGEDNSYYEEFTATGKIRCIDDEVPFDLPDGWTWARLENLFQIGPKVLADDHLSAAFIPMEAITAGYGSEYRFYERVWGSIKSGYTVFSDNDIAFAKITPCFQNRKSVIFEGLPNGIGAGTTELKVLRTYGETMIRRFALYFLKSPYFIEEASFKGTANQQRILVGYLESKLFPLPPLAEQERIVAKIEELMPWVEQYGKAQSELDQLNNSIQGRLKKSVLQYAIEGKLVPQQAEDASAEELLAEIQAEKQRLYAAGKLKKKDLAHSTIFRAEDGKYYEQVGKTITCIDEEIPFVIPESWRWVRICQLFFVTKLAGFEYTKYFTKDTISESNEIPIVRAKNVRMGWFKENLSERIPKRLSDLLQRSKLDRPALLMTFIGAGIGDVCIFQSEYEHHLAPNVAKLEPYFSTISLPYILVALMSPVGQLGVDAIKKSTAQPSLSMATIRGMLIPLPPLAEQQRIVSKLEEVLGVLNRLDQ